MNDPDKPAGLADRGNTFPVYTSFPEAILDFDSSARGFTTLEAVDPLYIGPLNGAWSTASNWSPATVPNGVGDVAFYDGIGSGSGGSTSVRQDIVAKVTLGTLSLTGSSDASFSVNDLNGFIFDQDGAGAGRATISNSNASSGTLNRLSISTTTNGSITLADDLLISNPGGSTSSVGAIQISEGITGTGNITFSNVSTAISQTASITLAERLILPAHC